MRWQRGIVDVSAHVETDGRVAVASTKMIPRGVDSWLSDDIAVLRHLVGICRKRELCRDPLDKHLAQLGDRCRRETQGVALDFDRLSKQLE